MKETKLVLSRVEIPLQDSTDIIGPIYLKGTPDPIGTFEGRLIKGGLFTVIHLDNPYQKRGIGFEIMQSVIARYEETGLQVIFMVGSWHRDKEFVYLPDSQSTNLSVFKAQLAQGKTNEQAALQTPTGKWAQQLGFGKAVLVKQTEEDVLVYFYKT
jgi:hypothetical protein